jgi:hypothetical protein
MISRVRAGSARSHTPGATRLRPYPSDSLAVTLKEGFCVSLQYLSHSFLLGCVVGAPGVGWQSV